MAEQSVFLQDLDFYQRKLNPITAYIEQNAIYLSDSTGKPIAECKAFIENSLRHKTIGEIRDPVVRFFHRDDSLDTNPDEVRLSKYISSVTEENLIIAPTMTCYKPTSEFESLQVGFTDINTKLRSIAKKASQKAEQAGDMLTYINKHNEQANKKMYNNAMSGGYVANGCVLQNPSAHSTLTSTTRTVSSLGNAANEKIIMGSRHYRDPDIVLANLISICTLTDLQLLQDVVEKYQLVYPSVEQTIECIKYSSDIYFRDDVSFQAIADYVAAVSPIKRAAVVYVSDLYHIRKYNEGFIRDLLTRLSRKVTGIHIEDAIAKLYAFDEAIVNTVHQICLTEVKGKGKDYAKMPYEDVCTLLATCYNIQAIVEAHRDFFKAIFLTKNMPCSTAYIPDMVRRAVVLSDTDSTMFSVDDWVKWYFGKLIFTDEAFALAGSVVFIASQCITHTLAIFSANVGVERKKLFTLAMKPEFVFPVFAQTSVGKHYYTIILVKEGNVYEKMKMEIKGVHLKNSASPPALIKDAHANMRHILETIMKDGVVSIEQQLTRAANIERDIQTSLLKGEVTYFKLSKTKQATAYKTEDPAKTPYQWHMFWNEVCSAKYGTIEEPPYSTIKIPTMFENKTKFDNWIASIQDQAFKERIMIWRANNNKATVPTIYLPLNYVMAYGIPVEFISAINIKKILLDLTNVNRMVLESLGYFPKREMLISELGY